MSRGTRTWQGRHRATLAAVVALAAVAGGVVLDVANGGSKPSAKDLIAADPPPALFTDTQVDPTAHDVASVRGQARQLLTSWVDAHGTAADDQGFVRWVEGQFPPPPADLPAQMSTVKSLAAQRTKVGVKAATWLETHGKKDVWKLYAHDQGERLDASHGKALKKEEKAALKLAKTLADALGTKFGSSAPYVRQPTLRPDHKVAAGQKCPCSYPSRHAAAGAASETLLGHLQPAMDPEYLHEEAEIDYSRIYMAGHFPGDITAGALLGDLVGDYLLVTRQGVDPASL